MACLEYANKVQASMQSLKETCEMRIKQIIAEKMEREGQADENNQVNRFKMPKSVQKASGNALDIVNRFVAQE